MKYVSRCLFALFFLVVLLLPVSLLADIRIGLIKGKRAVKDRISFTIEVSHEKNENPRYKDKPEFIEITGTFAGAASGIVELDGTGVQRFDNSTKIEGERTEITYGRHTVTLQVSEPAVATSLVVFVRGGLVREVVGESKSGRGAGGAAKANMSVEERVTDLERRMKQLELELERLEGLGPK